MKERLQIIKYLMSIILLQLFFDTYGQTKVSGKAFDKNTSKPIPNAIITLNKPNTTQITFFVLSKPSGEFEINSNLESDSLTITAKLLGYASKSINIANQSQVVNFALEESSIDLKEVKIKPEPIKKYGDTLSYTVSEFKNKNDRVIADVIKKLPGIEVNPNGQILYQGEPINKYYIEGLDLLEGRYKLANDNLNVESVSSVEIIENHQPIRMLDSLVFSDKAALNIKLKKAITTTGQMNIGSGFSPFLRDISISPMLFSKKNQLLISTQTNNIGKNQINQLKQLTSSYYKEGLQNLDNKQDWLKIQQLSPPPFNENRWLDNNSYLGSVNILKKLNNETELRFIGDYSYDRQQQEGVTKTLFFSNNAEDIMLIEGKANQLIFSNLKTDLTLQKNTRNKYFKNSLKVKSYWDSQTGNITTPNTYLIQKLNNPFFSISNDLKDLFKIGKSVFTLNSTFIFENVPQTLGVSPGQFWGLINNSGSFQKIQQKIYQKGFFTNNSIQFIKRIKQFSIDTQLGLIIEKQNLTSDIKLQNETETIIIGKDYKNNLDWFNQKYYISFQNRFKKGKLNFYLETPISLNIYDIEDKDFRKNQKLNQVTFEPRLNLNFELNKFWNWSFSSGKKNYFGNLNQMYFGYIMTSYRDFQRINAPISQSINYSNSIGLNYRNPVNSTFGGINFNYAQRQNNLLYINKINPFGYIEKTAIAKKNNNFSGSFSGRLGKYFREIKTTFTIITSLFNQRSSQIINEQITLIESKGINPSFKISSNPINWFGLEYNYKFSKIRNIIDNVPKQTISLQNHELKLNFNPKENFYIGISNEAYFNSFNKTQNLFSDLIFRKTLGQRKLDLEANWLNIFNSKSLIIPTNSNFSYTETSYTLRPSQILVKIRIPF